MCVGGWLIKYCISMNYSSDNKFGKSWHYWHPSWLRPFRLVHSQSYPQNQADFRAALHVRRQEPRRHQGRSGDVPGRTEGGFQGQQERGKEPVILPSEEGGVCEVWPPELPEQPGTQVSLLKLMWVDGICLFIHLSISLWIGLSKKY